jgi:signal transduction histidine kinase
VLLLVGFSLPLLAQLTTYDPNKLSVLEKKLAQTEIKTARATILLDLHDQLMYSDADRAYSYNDEALNIAQQLKDELLLARAYGNKGNEHFDAANLDRALDYYRKANALISTDRHPLIVALNYSNMSNVFALKGDFGTSLEYAFRAIEICKNNNPAGLNLQCHTRANLADSYIHLQQYEKAEYLLKLNLQALDTLATPTVKAMTFGNLGEVYLSKKNYKVAIQYLKEGLGQTEPWGLDYFTANLSSNLGQLYLLDQQPLQGLPYARRARQLSILNEDAQVQTSSCRNMAQIFLELQQLDSAQYYAQLALDLAQSKGIQSIKPSVLTTYAAIAKKLGKFDRCLQALQQARQLRDNIVSDRTKTESIQRLEAFSAFETKQYMNHLYADQLSYAKFLRWMNSLGIVLTLFIGLGVFSLYQQRQKVNVILTQKGQAIDLQRKRLEDLNEIKDKLFTTISEELRTPLNSIQQVLSSLNEGKTSDAKEADTVLSQLQQHTVRTITLLEDLLFTARVQMNQYQPLRQEFFLKPLVNDLDKHLRLLSDGSFTPIIYHVPADLDLYGDAKMLKMVLRNLMLALLQKPENLMFPLMLTAWKQNDHVCIRVANVEEKKQPEAEPQNIDQLKSAKPYWDTRLIKTFIEGYGGQLMACPEGKGFELILPDAHG